MSPVADRIAEDVVRVIILFRSALLGTAHSTTMSRTISRLTCAITLFFISSTPAAWGVAVGAGAGVGAGNVGAGT